ncbi:hypothetical protein [Jonesia quinghaiensis]|uniref:hypothetical protein n=1 Tax=Jonesia quinghaiensis TaxID=262806 RepID=UPI0012FC0027|nr:hypothetical protein [Jonesia quinghaiensis]
MTTRQQSKTRPSLTRSHVSVVILALVAPYLLASCGIPTTCKKAGEITERIGEETLQSINVPVDYLRPYEQCEYGPEGGHVFRLPDDTPPEVIEGAFANEPWANVEEDVWAQRVDDIDITAFYLEADSTIEFTFMVN